MPSRLQHDAYRGSDPLIGLHDWERCAARPRAALEEHDKSPLVDYPRPPATSVHDQAAGVGDRQPLGQGAERQPALLAATDAARHRRASQHEAMPPMRPRRLVSDPKAYVA